MASMRVNEVGEENGEENGEEKLTVLIKDNLRISKRDIVSLIGRVTKIVVKNNKTFWPR